MMQYFVIVSVYFLNIEIICAEEGAFTIKTKGCIILNSHPYNNIKYPKDFEDCADGKLDLTESNETHVWIKSENFDIFYIQYEDEFSCCYKYFYRNQSKLQESDCKPFKEFLLVGDDIEFVQVDCSYMEMNIYTNFYPFVPRKIPSKAKLGNKNLNIIVVGLESMSRMNFHRTMPNTLKYLNDKGGIEMLGYNKLGDNSLPNLMPLLVGGSIDMFGRCLVADTWQNDKCPFLWDLYQRAGYLTALGADSEAGLFELYFKFNNSLPTDYYLHPFIVEANKKISHKKPLFYYACMGYKHYYSVLLDYIRSLTTSLKNDKLFGFFWEQSLSHDLLNGAMIMDENFVKFFRTLEYTNYLDNTVFILLGDHGFRFGDIVLSNQGDMEARLPLLYFLLPKSFPLKYKRAYRNIKRNAGRLTTPNDVYITILDLLNMTKLRSPVIKAKQMKSYFSHKEISLFLPTPKNRTCISAGIPEHWCTCYDAKQLAAKDRDAKEAASHLLLHINNLLKPHSQCQKFSIKKIVAVLVTKDDHGLTYRATIATLPGGIFDGTLHQEGNLWALSDTVSRLDIYRNQSYCMKDFKLQMYCYCKQAPKDI